MRLLALTTSYPLRTGASAGVFVQSLYRHLPSGWTVDVLCPADATPSTPPAHGAPPAPSPAPDIRVHAVRYAPRPWRTLAQGAGGIVSGLRRAPWRLGLLPLLLGGLFWRTLALAGRADVLHANWAICGALAGVAGRLHHRPVVTTLRGDDVTRAAHSRIDRILLALAMRHSHAVVCVSEAMAVQLRARFPARAADIHVGLNGAEAAFFKVVRQPAVRPGLRILAVGSLIRRKGFDTLIEALGLARHRTAMEVTLVGEGPEEAALRTLAAARGVSSALIFAGPVPAPEMPARYATADLFVLSSRSEGRPNVVVEAMAAGLPVVSTALPGVQGLVQEGVTGRLVPVDDPAALAAVLDQAAEDPALLTRMGQRAGADARTRLGTWEATSNTYAALFRAACNPPRHPSTPPVASA